jgi:hypothetical protein
MTIIEKRFVFDINLLDKKGEENQRPKEDYCDRAKLIRDIQKPAMLWYCKWTL